MAGSYNKGYSNGILRGIAERLKKIFGHNIATIIFGILFLYMALSAIVYMTSNHIESYQVISGPLSSNETYTGLCIREESVVKSESGGYVNYYAREGTKINANGAVYGLSPTKTQESDTKLSQEELSRIREQMLSFSKGFNSSNFNNTYSFKNQLEGTILQYQGVTGQSDYTAALTYEEFMDRQAAGEETINGSGTTVTLGNQTISKALADGIILYSKDGYEGKTLETVTTEDFDQNSYHETDLKTKNMVKAGDEIYTIITDERWSLLIPLSDKQAVKLSNRTSVRVKFLKDDMTQSGSFSIVKLDGAKYGKIDFEKGLIRYASDRFLDIELVTNTVTGLKIPLTSIVTKDFYTIPSTFATVDPNTDAKSFTVTRKIDGKKQSLVISPTIYSSVANPKKNLVGTPEYEDEEIVYTYYVDCNSFQAGDTISLPNSQTKFIVGDKAPLEGVYCINQGYAVFRRITILDQNEEYAIISKNTAYGLTRYDHIVRNAQNVKEEDILY